jgi:uncharacterized YigZ family protein
MSITDTYLCIERPTEATFKEKGSKFLAFAYPVNKEEEVKNNLIALRKVYFDATHHCYAYILGYRQEKTRANDDGEPNGSAGLPILGQIRSKGLTNVLIVVVRYFGGTKLGVSGLVSAYKTAAAEALQNAELITKIIVANFEITFDYLAMNSVMKIVKEYGLQILSQDFDNQCRMELSVRQKHWETVRGAFLKIEGLAWKEKD